MNSCTVEFRNYVLNELGYLGFIIFGIISNLVLGTFGNGLVEPFLLV